MRMIYIIVSPVRAFQLDLYDGRRHALRLPTTQQEIRDEAQSAEPSLTKVVPGSPYPNDRTRFLTGAFRNRACPV